MKVIKSDELKELLNIWTEIFEVYAPKHNDGQVMLLPYEEDKFTMEFINFPFPVKEHLFKQKEKLFTWEKKDESIKVEPYENNKKTKRLLFGIRPCDAYGISYMDRFFLEGYVDELYKGNRDSTYIAVLNCVNPGKDCFCSSLGVGPFSESGYDLLFTPIGDSYIIEAGSEKGKELVALGEEIFSRREVNYAVNENMLEKKRVLLESALNSFVTKLKVEDMNKLLEENFNNPIWESLAKDCIRCTGCTSLCPTCTCFNVLEEDQGNYGTRVRCWDSCQSDSFTRNAGEHNPRNNISRVRYRIYDKMKYIEEKFGFKGCTGCGRCINVCPAGINVVKIINDFANARLELIEHESNKNQSAADESVAELVYTLHNDIAHFHDNKCESVYTPQTAIITDIIEETRNIKRFYMRYEDQALMENFKFSGQFFEITVFGVGEIAISIPFSPNEKYYFDFCIKKAGKVTTAIHNMKVGDKVGLRGPFGKGFPYEEFKGKDVIIVGSGVGLAPVRTMILRILENREDFGKVVIIGSALSYEDLVYKEDLLNWDKREDVKVLYALSNPTEKVKAHVGYINDLLPNLGLNWQHSASIICASPRRIKAVAKDLINLGMKSTDIYTSLETHMRCGIGKCGHCKVGNKYMCIDGPVFNYEEMLTLPPEF